MENGRRLFVVGSDNPVKIGCVADAVTEFWPTAVVRGIPIESRVPSQPRSVGEMQAGALHRARGALSAMPDADYGVGLEGGIEDSEQGMWAFAWITVLDRQGRAGVGQSGRFMLPEGVAALVRAGLELGDADDRFFGTTDSKRKEGAIGILSDRRITRAQLYHNAVVFALLSFVHPEYYAR